MTPGSIFSLVIPFAQTNSGDGGGLFTLMPLFAMIGLLFYFMVLRPETKRQSDQKAMHADLKKNDRIITIGGIHGTVTNVSGSDEVTVKIDEATNTKIRITRTAIQKVVNSKDSSKESGGDA